MSDGRDVLRSQVFWELGVLADEELAQKLWIWPRASNESVGEADLNCDLSFMTEPHEIKSRRQTELPPGPRMGWSNSALGVFCIGSSRDLLTKDRKLKWAGLSFIGGAICLTPLPSCSLSFTPTAATIFVCSWMPKLFFFNILDTRANLRIM